MSPSRRDILKATGAVTAALVLPPALSASEPAVIADVFDEQYLFAGAVRGNVSYQVLGSSLGDPMIHTYVTRNGGVHTTVNPLSPKAQRIYARCLAQMAAVFAIEQNEEGWD